MKEEKWRKKKIRKYCGTKMESDSQYNIIINYDNFIHVYITNFVGDTVLTYSKRRALKKVENSIGFGY